MLKLLLTTLLLAVPCFAGPGGWVTLPGSRALIMQPHAIVMVTMHSNGGVEATYARSLAEAREFAEAPVVTPQGVIVGYSSVTSMLIESGATYTARQGPIVGGTPPAHSFVTTWTDVSGAIHTVTTPGGRSDSVRRHLRDVRVFQEAFPPMPLPAVQPTPLPDKD